MEARRRPVVTETPMKCPLLALPEQRLIRQSLPTGRLLFRFRFRHLRLPRTRHIPPCHMGLAVSSSLRKRTVDTATHFSQSTSPVWPTRVGIQVPAMLSILVMCKSTQNILRSLTTSMLSGIRQAFPREGGLPCQRAIDPTLRRSFELPLALRISIRCRLNQRMIRFPWKAIRVSSTWIHRRGRLRHQPGSIRPLRPRDIQFLKLEMPKIRLT